MKIKNPIIRGFNPDPSIIRVGEDYYIANSTFEWFPGVQIHHSKDLKNWKLIKHPLERISQLNMKGNPDSCGVWAPCLTYADGQFWLIYSDVKRFDGVWKDTHNYLTTCKTIDGEWSDPVYINSSGFDASLFHDDDGKKYILNLLVDHRKGKFFGGIIIQEFDPETKKLVGPVKHIFEGSELGITEGPHIYKLNGYYYLMTAEGGTEYGHAVTLARSKDLFGPYELHPNHPVVTARNNPKLPLQKTGHADIVETPDGEWFMVFLTGDPLSELGRCTLGRETSIQKVEWREDDWLWLAHGGNEPLLEIDGPKGIEESVWDKTPDLDGFDSLELDINYQSLRVPFDESWCSLKERPGFLRIYGRESLCSTHSQSMVARRQQSHFFEASAAIEFNPTSFQQMAGLTYYYNTGHFYYIYISHEPDRGRIINILMNDYLCFSEPLGDYIDIPESGTVFLKIRVERNDLFFYYSLDNQNWSSIGGKYDASIISDDYVRGDGRHEYAAAFTGAFIGMTCQDLTGMRLNADFDWFKYKEL